MFYLVTGGGSHCRYYSPLSLFRCEPDRTNGREAIVAVLIAAVKRIRQYEHVDGLKL